MLKRVITGTDWTPLPTSVIKMEAELTVNNRPRVGFLFALVCTTFSLSMFIMSMNTFMYEGNTDDVGLDS